jgi:hypothetical protein
VGGDGAWPFARYQGSYGKVVSGNARPLHPQIGLPDAVTGHQDAMGALEHDAAGVLNLGVLWTARSWRMADDSQYFLILSRRRRSLY